MRKKIKPYYIQSFIKQFRSTLEQFIVPLTIFQGIRTILLPTMFDIILLAILLFLAAALYMERG
ncbi:MAG: hypothetical protein C6W58_00120 [Bacillaceae bacterium]|jgi:hypothetical protein|uniref:Uncharacterized protein n=2 Tax=Aeribacillus TaxID=1055323 RepID=A0A165XVG7_9BACI|nr:MULTISPECIES: hypothetical protein [Aeribacillus]REJ21349.1 MAG: hypothetical protein C6W58_00120 [Bacillaceae bacterium]ASS92064.1 hypothetical protein AP3564_18965 [Aeribacillus pallidus]KZN96451.1 hypothetical protein AZI98_08430 [Aeribacillus pallidus]MDR9791559.1 hypothetical protein [Aeribacillus pallidus]MDR9795912.1 hypothetical protein [Aeribacillus pallidus]